MKQIENVGNKLEGALAELDARLDSPAKAAIFGVSLGIGLVVSGIAAFLIVLFILVNLFA